MPRKSANPAALSKADLYNNAIMSPSYDLLGIFEAKGPRYIIELTMRYARANAQSKDALRALAQQLRKAEREQAKAKAQVKPQLAKAA